MNHFESALTKRVSYILATKDRAQYLERALHLARDVKKPNDELIIIDGLSKDNTPEIVHRHMDIVDVFISEKDMSEGHAFNKGILLSRGKYIKLLTDDDVIYPEAMEQAIQVMEENPEVDILRCGGTRQTGEHYSIVYVPPGANYGKQVEDVLFRYGACGIGLVIRRSALSRVGLLNANAVALDVDFLTQCISRNANVKFCRINMFHHPIEDHSGTVKRKQEWEMDIARIRRQYGFSESYPQPLLKAVLIQMLRRYTPGFIKSPLRSIAKRVRSQKRTEIQESGDREEPVWDGGFS